MELALGDKFAYMFFNVEKISSKLKDCIIKTNWSDCFQY